VAEAFTGIIVIMMVIINFYLKIKSIVDQSYQLVYIYFDIQWLTFMLNLIY